MKDLPPFGHVAIAHIQHECAIQSQAAGGAEQNLVVFRAGAVLSSQLRPVVRLLSAPPPSQVSMTALAGRAARVVSRLTEGRRRSFIDFANFSQHGRRRCRISMLLKLFSATPAYPPQRSLRVAVLGPSPGPELTADPAEVAGAPEAAFAGGRKTRAAAAIARQGEPDGTAPYRHHAKTEWGPTGRMGR